MKNLSLFDFIIGIVTSISFYSDGSCDDNLIPNTEEPQINIPNVQNVVQANNMFNVLHQNINQFEQENDIANLEYNYRFERYFNFRRQLGQIRARVDGYIIDANIYATFNQQNVNIPQQIRILSNYLQKYDIFLTGRQMGHLEGTEPDFNY